MRIASALAATAATLSLSATVGAQTIASDEILAPDHVRETGLEPTPPPPPSAWHESYEAPPVPMVTIDNSRALRITGTALTLSGAAVGTAAWTLFFATADDENLLASVGGLTFGVIGSLVCLTGIPLWIAGEYDIEVPRNHPKAIDQLGGAELLLGPTGGHVKLTF